MSKRTNPTPLLFVLFLLSAVNVSARATLSASTFGFRFAHALILAATDREQDGLVGPVRRVKTETAKIAVKNGKPAEGPRNVLEATTYDQKGNRVDNAYFLSAGGSLTGKEVYKYDERGNIVEMTLHNADGSLLAKEVYNYEFDAVGNWTKMTTSVAVIEGGQISFEPSEVTYRTISYYLDETMMAKMSQPASMSQPAAQPASSPAAQGKPAQTQTARANPKEQASAPAQAKPSTAAFSPAPQPSVKRSASAAPVVLASLDKGVAASPGLPVAFAGSNSSEGGPAVKSDGEAPAQPVMRGPLKPISGGILNGKALSLPAPSYPDAARRMHTSGTVEVEVVIDMNGKVISAKAVKGPSLLMLAAEQAAKQAKFTPTLLSGQPVKISGIITYNFSL
ncbi:MAG TPA: TonB family protein [Pyrinomonadaceae bacterium]|jgi:protein TonB|nr:TonB family protein [Pyrinomonadaceae bacterium]